jgi:hypothetical protein
MFYPLLVVLLGVPVVAVSSIFDAAQLAPDGYEDDNGFHLGEIPTGGMPTNWAESGTQMS